MIYPQGGDIHGDNEWVSFDSLLKLYAIFEDFLAKI
jgi:acetylornithine deacetylase/succinyl-diaminopimelate desuccinylase-like protein